MRKARLSSGTGNFYCREVEYFHLIENLCSNCTAKGNMNIENQLVDFDFKIYYIGIFLRRSLGGRQLLQQKLSWLRWLTNL